MVLAKNGTLIEVWVSKIFDYLLKQDRTFLDVKPRALTPGLDIKQNQMSWPIEQAWAACQIGLFGMPGQPFRLVE